MPIRHFWRPLVLGLGGAGAIFAALWAALWLVLTRTRVFDSAWLDGAVDALGGLAAVGPAFLLYSAVAAGIMTLILERTVATVEARHYPNLAPVRRGGAGQALAAPRLIATAIVLNLAILPSTPSRL